MMTHEQFVKLQAVKAEIISLRELLLEPAGRHSDAARRAMMERQVALVGVARDIEAAAAKE